MANLCELSDEVQSDLSQLRSLAQQNRTTIGWLIYRSDEILRLGHEEVSERALCAT